MIPAETKTTAIARSGLVPHQSQTIRSIPPPATHGITRNCVSGPTKNAVSGEAIFSIDCPNPKTLPCRSSGTTFWRIVCSQASAIGPKSMKKKNPIPTSQIEDTRGKNIQIDHVITLVKSSDFTGLFPSQYRLTSIPPIINPVLVSASIIPQTSTDTMESPYASINAINTPPRKLFHIAKNIIPKSQDIPAIIRTVPRISTFFSSGCRSSRCGSGGNVSIKRCAMSARVRRMTIPTTQIIPNLPMRIPENTDTTVKTNPLTAPTCPLALSLSHSGIRSVTIVERAIIRILPTNIPKRETRINIQNHKFPILLHIEVGTVRRIIPART